MNGILNILAILIFPSGIFLLLNGLAYEWVDRKMLARLQNRVGPRWFQPVADVVKLLVKEEVLPRDANHTLFFLLPIIAVAGPLTAALYVPIAGLPPAFSFQGRPDRDALPAKPADVVHRAGRGQHAQPLLAGGGHPHPDAAFCLRGTFPHGAAGASDCGRELAD